MSTYSNSAQIQKEMAAYLLKIASPYMNKKIRNILEIGCGSGFITQLIVKKFPNATFYINDLVEESFFCIKSQEYKYYNLNFMPGDIESLSLPQNLDMIISGATLQWLSNPKLFFKRIIEHLSPKGLLIFSSFGKNNFKEIQTIFKSGLTYLDQDTYLEYFQNNFKMKIFQSMEKTIWFENLREVIKHMRNTGTSGIKKQTFTPGKLLNLSQKYLQLFGNEKNQLPLTYHPTYIIAERN